MGKERDWKKIRFDKKGVQATYVDNDKSTSL